MIISRESTHLPRLLAAAAAVAGLAAWAVFFRAGLVLAGSSIARRLKSLPSARRIATRLAGVALIGFGTFTVAKRAARNGRNPQTGKPIKIAAKRVAKFKAGSELSAKVR